MSFQSMSHAWGRDDDFRTTIAVYRWYVETHAVITQGAATDDSYVGVFLESTSGSGYWGDCLCTDAHHCGTVGVNAEVGLKGGAIGRGGAGENRAT